MNRTSLFALLLSASIGAALAAEPAATQHGFLVFSSGGITNYAVDAKDELHLQGKASAGGIGEFITANGRIYHLDTLLGKVTELGADLKPIREAAVKSITDVPFWLGLWDKGLLILNDNSVVYLDADLNEVAQLPLEPRSFGQITPALNPKDFDVWEHRGYLLASSAEVFIIPLDTPPAAEPLHAALRIEDGFFAEGQWIDPADHTLNLIGMKEREETNAKLKPGEWRVIKQQVVYTHDLKNLASIPFQNVIHEEREIHESRAIDSNDSGHPDGVISERQPPYRSEGIKKGTYIGIKSKSTPTYAEVFEEKADQPIAQFAIARLKSRGRYEKLELNRENKNDPLWFKGEAGIRYVESDMQQHVLRLQPVPYGKLHALPELHDVYFNALAY